VAKIILLHQSVYGELLILSFRQWLAVEKSPGKIIANLE